MHVLGVQERGLDLGAEHGVGEREPNELLLPMPSSLTTARTFSTAATARSTRAFSSTLGTSPVMSTVRL